VPRDSYNQNPVPKQGQPIQYGKGEFQVPDRPLIPFIEGDGTGRDIWKAASRVFDAAVEKAYGGKRRVIWYELLAGEKSFQKVNSWLPEETVEAIRDFRIAIKGPLTTPIGGGIRSLNVTLRQVLDLYVCWRPVRYFPGVPSPVVHPEKLNVVIYRENTEDVYAGIEWASGSDEARRVIELVSGLGKKIRSDSGVGIKPISPFGSKRLVRRAIQYALQTGRKRVTLVHKGNIMKFTEGAFRQWGYEVGKEEFADVTVTEEEVMNNFGGKIPEGKVQINDRIADSMFQQILLRPDEYEILATPNLNGDYISDAAAAQVGGLGMAPGGNIGDGYGVFEATHGTAPKYADKDMVNPGSMLLSGAMMFEFMGWKEVSQLIEQGIARTIGQKRVTYDLERQMPGATKLRTSEFASAIIENMAAVSVTA
jgi:isocitrate dehydrogenase